ncbi:MAG: acyl-CoA dehydrogenase, partial [Burkholderia sp.]|nr:acyl-CoA dehydrogenase [Burkholderia sp.]
MQTTQHDPYQDIREAVRDLCRQFPGEYFRKIDDARGYPDA